MTNKTILVVDDDEVNVYLIKNFLSVEGFVPLVEIDSKKVLEVVLEKKPDAIVMDIMMPDITGDELAKILKEKPETKDIPIILVTASIMIEKEGLFADYFIRRPIVADDLIDALKTLLKI